MSVRSLFTAASPANEDPTAPRKNASAYERTKPVWMRRPAAASRRTPAPTPFTSPSTPFASKTSAENRAAAVPGFTNSVEYAWSTYQPFRRRAGAAAAVRGG